MEQFAPFVTGTPIKLPFDQSLPLGEAANHSCQMIHAMVEQTLATEQRPLLLGGECSLIAGSLAPALERLEGLRLAFFDAHGDFNTPETSPSQYLGGMCFAHVCGLVVKGLPWGASRAFPGSRAFLIGGRELDPGEDLNLAKAGVLRFDPAVKDAVARISEAVKGALLWIHVDLDVVDPAENFAVSHPALGGISFSQLAEFLAGIARSSAVQGIEVCGYQPAKDPERTLPSKIAAAISPAL
jgi:arginase/N-omega-hydroxy-L-arginine amidinohydrolase